MKNTFLFLFLTGFLFSTAQKGKKEEKQLLANLQRHIQYLASDSLEGRRVGTRGEQLAMTYISSEFKTAGLSPKGSVDFYQSFDINEGKQINSGTHLTVGGQSLLLHTHFVPLSFSPNISLEALPSMSIQELQMPWFFDIKEVLEGSVSNPHFDIYQFLKTKATEIKPKGATALFVYNSSSVKDGIQFKGREGAELTSIPVVYLTPESLKKYFNDHEATLDLKLKIDIGPKKRVGHNVIGLLDNKASRTVVIGAHFDHLGYGEDGNSLSTAAPAQIHNGADDNASGVAAMIELARLLKEPGMTGSNYLFIAFSGEEMGLLGSKYFVQHPTIDLKQVNFMINLDMIGRVNETNGSLSVGGFGTSPAWASAYASSGKKGINHASLNFRFDSSGTGPSDHTSFYQQGIPVLFFFSGVHSDYHKPSDDPEKINYNGELNVIKHIYSLIEWQVKNKSQIAFTITRETGMQGNASFSVTLGIMPDYSYDGTGLRVDGVIDNRPAQKAGLKTGDIIMQLGVHATSSMENYMKALGAFKKGDKTTVQVLRGKESKSFPIEF